MFSKNLRYYRLKCNMTRKELAERVHVSPMAISYYESGERRPGMETIKALAEALHVRVTDFLNEWNENLVFSHGEFRKNSALSARQQDFIRESAEEYMNRFFSVVDILGDEVLPPAPAVRGLELVPDEEKDALAMRRHLKIAEDGPVGNLIELLENRGILVYFCETESDAFSGMNGLVNGRPYLIVNSRMSSERIRSTIAHEMAHFLFSWPDSMDEKEIEAKATAIGGAFLFSKKDAERELGLRRSAVTRDMYLVCREYGISMYLLVKRANLCGIISDPAARDFYSRAGRIGWKKNEPSRIEREEPALFEQFVFRAVSENEISVQKGAELLRQPCSYIEDHCFAEGGP